MSDDLNEFLRQAALRREARKRQSGSQGGAGSSSQNPTAQPPAGKQIKIEVIQPIPVEQRHITPGIPSGEHLGGTAAKLDREREAHLQEVFGNKPAPLEAKKKKKSKPQVGAQVAPQIPTAAQVDFAAAMDSLTASQGGQLSVSSHDLIAFLRNPSSLKMAFIASEIFSRKFQ
jgi:hypothetical protein